MSFITSKALPIALGLRGVQILFAILLLIMGAVAVSKYNDTGYSRYFSSGYPAMGIVSGIISLLFYVPLLVPSLVPFYTPVYVLAGEIFTWIWWLIAFACAAHYFGEGSCDFGLYYSDIDTGCSAGKAEIAFGVLGWVLSSVTLVLVIVYSIVPASKNQGYYVRDHYTLGGVFPRFTEAPSRADNEAAIGAESEEIKTTAETEGYTSDQVVSQGSQFEGGPGYPVESLEPVPPALTR